MTPKQCLSYRIRQESDMVPWPRHVQQVHQNIETQQLPHHRTSLLKKSLLANVPQNIPYNDIIQFIINLHFIQLKASDLSCFN